MRDEILTSPILVTSMDVERYNYVVRHPFRHGHLLGHTKLILWMTDFQQKKIERASEKKNQKFF